MSTIKGGIRNYKALKKELQQIQKVSETAINRTMSDIRDRVPGWIAEGVTDRYGPKKNRRTLKAEILSGKLGTLTISGGSPKSVRFTYKGERLTPVHFGMSPTAPKGSGAYTLKAEIRQGTPTVLGRKKKLTKRQLKNVGRNFTRQSTQNSPQSPWMLQRSGEDNTPYIPFQRRGQTENMSYVFKTVSLPQMVTQGENGPLHPEVAAQVIPKLEKRIVHHLKPLEK